MAKKKFSKLNAILSKDDKADAPTIKRADLPEPPEELVNSIEDEELRQVLKERRAGMVGRPRKDTTHISRTDGYNRTSLVINVGKWEKFKYIALHSTLTLKEVMDVMLDMFIEQYESVHGEIVLPDDDGDNKTKIFTK